MNSKANEDLKSLVETTNDDIDLVTIVSFFIRNKKYILLSIIVAIILCILYSVFLKKNSYVLSVPVEPKIFLENKSNLNFEIVKYINTIFKEKNNRFNEELNTLSQSNMNNVISDLKFDRTKDGFSISAQFLKNENDIESKTLKFIDNINQASTKFNDDLILSFEDNPEYVYKSKNIVAYKTNLDLTLIASQIELQKILFTSKNLLKKDFQLKELSTSANEKKDGLQDLEENFHKNIALLELQFGIKPFPNEYKYLNDFILNKDLFESQTEKIKYFKESKNKYLPSFKVVSSNNISFSKVYANNNENFFVYLAIIIFCLASSIILILISEFYKKNKLKLFKN